MAKRDNHYEAAFEAFLRGRGVPYVAVDETKRSLLGSESIKNLDFIVSAADGRRWLVDVKGRLFPSVSRGGKHYWKNWSTRDDLKSLTRWERLFGDGFQALFVFAYQVVGERAPLPRARLFSYRDRLYGFLAIRLQQYLESARVISPKWDTVAMPTPGFRESAQALDELF